MKLASELHRRSTGRSLYILDEPTTGLHVDDIARFLKCFNGWSKMEIRFLSLNIILDVIKTADYIVDLGPEGGDKGGTIIASGTPEKLQK